MSFSINSSKETATPRKPIVLADVTFSDGSTWHAATIGCTYGGNTYVPALTDQNIDRLQFLSEQGIDRIPSASITIADPDGTIYTTYERGVDKGFRGATLLLRLALLDVITGEFSTDSFVPFIGTCDQPSVDEKGLTVTAANKLNLSALQLPTVPICARCPWLNPSTTQQRTEAADPNSRFYRCGETRDLVTAPPCSYTKQTCTQPQRYGGSTWQPAKQGTGREYISGNRLAWTNPDTSGKYRQYWPEWLGGAAWVEVPILNQWADGNYTRGEAAVGVGKIYILKVIANGIELSQGMSGDYRWHYVNDGSRDGAHNTDTGYADGDVYGNETVIQFLAPHAVLDPNSQASIRVLARTDSAAASVAIVSATGSGTGPIEIQFGRLMGTGDPGDGSLVTISGSTWDAVNGTFVLRYLDHDYTHAFLEGTIATGSGTGGTLYYSSTSLAVGGAVPTPWVIQSGLKASGRFSDPDFGTTWSGAGTIASSTITYTDGDGNTGSGARFSSSVALKDRRSTGEIVRGLRQSMPALLYFGQDGKLEIAVEGPLGEQQSAPVDGSNYGTPITSTLRDGTTANGYIAYDFDASNCWNLKRTAQQNGTTPNRVSFPFVDPANDWAVSTFAEIDPEDVSRMEQETAGGLQVQPEGIASYNHAFRCAHLGLAKVLRGNPAGDTRGTDWWQWETSFRACKLRVGQIVRLADPVLISTPQLVRITGIQPSRNYETVTLTGHHHEDSWYSDAPSTLADPGRSFYHYTPPPPTTPGVPTPPDNVTIGTITVDDAHYTPTGTGKGRRLIAKRPIAVAYTPPDPVGTFRGVFVSVAADDGGTTPSMDASTPLSTTVSMSGTAPQKFGPFAFSETGASVRFEINEPNWRTGASPVTEKVTLISYSDDVTIDAASSPSATFTLSPPETSKPGAATAHTQNPTGVTIPATFPDGTPNPYLDNSTGKSKTYLLVHQDPPDDPLFAGVAWRVSDDPDGIEIINASGPQKEADFELVFDTPSSIITGYVWAPGVDADGNVNPIVPGITPMATVTLGTTGGTVDPRELIDSWLESAEFHVDPTTGKFSMKNVDFSKAMPGTFSTEFTVSGGVLNLGTFSADKIKTGVLEVGGGTRASRLKVFDTSGTPALIGWIGDDSAGSGYVGAWFKRIMIGGTAPGSAQIVADASGNVAISGSLIVGNIAGSAASITGAINASQVNAGTFNGFHITGTDVILNLNGVTTTLGNIFDSGSSRYAGIKCVENSSGDYAMMHPYGFYSKDNAFGASSQMYSAGGIGVLNVFAGGSGGNFAVTVGAGGLAFSMYGLPTSAPAAGSRQVWYDPATGNLKYVP